MRRKRKILIWSTSGRIVPYEKYVQKNSHFWEQKFLLLPLLIKKYIQVPWTYQKVSFLYSKEPLWNNYSDKNLHKLGGSKHASKFIRSIRSWNCKLSISSLVEILAPVFEIKFKKSNLELFRKNYSSCNRIYMFLEYLIPDRMFDIF